MATIARPVSVAEAEPHSRQAGRVWSFLAALESRRSFWAILSTAGAAARAWALWPVLFGDGPVTASGLRGLGDRVEALGGRLRVWRPHGGGKRVRAELPCA